MIWNRIVIKLGGSIIVLFLVVLLPLGFVIDQIFSGFYYNHVREEIDQLSSRYVQSIINSRNLMMVNIMKMMAEFSQVNLYVVDAEGKVLVNSGVPGLAVGSYIYREEVKALASGKSIEKEYKHPPSGSHFLVSGKPLIKGNNFYGGIYILSSINEIDQSIRKVRSLLFLSGVGAFFLALGFTFILSRKLSDPLVQMERATRQIAKGDLDIRVRLKSGDEIGSLASAINDLAFDLQIYRDSRKEFFANISHELRTPITYLKGYAKVLKEGLHQNEEEKEQYLDIIYQESLRITRLIEDLFELAKMEEGKIEMDFGWINLAEVIDSAILKTRLKAKEKGLEIRVNIQDGLPLIYGDGVRMEQIFMNLLDNAIRYTEQGTISLQVENINHNIVRIRIEDTGIGIPEDERPFIFERFYRVEKSRSRQYGGTGLGLAIVKMLVELHGGTISVFSEVGKGTKFEIIFPVHTER